MNPTVTALSGILVLAVVLAMAGVIDLTDPAMMEAEMNLPAPVYVTLPELELEEQLVEIPEAAVVTATAERGTQLQATETLPPPSTVPSFTPGDCHSLAALFGWHGATGAELDFFFGRTGGTNIIFRESGCGLDTYNDRTGDTGFCQLTHLHSKEGWFYGTYWGAGGWTVPLFDLVVGKAHRGIDRDHPNMIPACLWLLRGGSFEPGQINRQPWRLQ